MLDPATVLAIRFQCSNSTLIRDPSHITYTDSRWWELHNNQHNNMDTAEGITLEDGELTIHIRRAVPKVGTKRWGSKENKN